MRIRNEGEGSTHITLKNARSNEGSEKGRTSDTRYFTENDAGDTEIVGDGRPPDYCEKAKLPWDELRDALVTP